MLIGISVVTDIVMKTYLSSLSKVKLSKEWILILVLALFKLLLHFFTSTNYELHRDAYLYLALGDHLDLGYLSVPPSIAVLARVTRILFGDSVFSIRIFPALIGTISVVIIGLMVKRLGGGIWVILIACVAFITSPAFLRSNALFQPVSFNQFYWLLSCYMVMRMLQTEKPHYWYYLSIIWGFAFLNKYAISFLILAILISLVLTTYRRLIFTRQFLFSTFIGFLIILPNLIWQYNHNWPVITHMQELQRTQLVNVKLIDFIVAQFLMNFPAILVWLSGLAFLLFFKKGKTYRVIGLSYVVVILLLMLLRGKPYYTLGIYTTLFAFGGFMMETHFKHHTGFIKPIVIILMILISLPLLPYSLPVLKHEEMLAYAAKSKQWGAEGALRWEDGRIHELPQDYADMIGWQELGEIVVNAYLNLTESEKDSCAIYGENYGQAGAVKYVGRKYGIPEPISFSASFLFWAPDSVKINTLIYINHNLGDDVSYYFSVVKQVGKMMNKNAREYGLPVYLCKGPRNGFEQFYREKVRELKSRYR